MSAIWRWALGVVAILVVVIAAVIILFDWNWLRSPLEARLSAATGKQVRILGSITGAWSWSPRIAANDVHIEDPTSRSAPKVATIDHVEVVVDLERLLGGSVALPEIDIERPVFDLERDANGKANWDIAREARGPTSRSGMPIIGALKIENGRLTYRDLGKHTTLDATIDTITAKGGTGHEAVALVGRGTYRKAPFSIRLKGGSFEELRETNEPYDVDIAASVGRTKVTIKGTVTDPFKMTGMNVKLTAEGDNAEELYPIFGVPAPSTPPYHLTGTLDRNGQIWLFKNFSGTVGKSDLKGSLRFEPNRPRLFVSGDLLSKNLNFADLGLLVGATGSTAPDRPVSEQQRRMAEQYAHSDRVLPDAPLNLNEVRSVDADVTFKGEHIEAQTLPLDNADLHLKLDNAILSLVPLHVGVAGGLVDAAIVINARNDPVTTDYDVRLRRFQLAQFFERAGFPQGGQGLVDGRIRLRGSGDSVRRSLAHSDGEASLMVDHGTISNLAADILGLDVARAIGLVITGNDTQVPLNCMVADFEVRDGTMRPRLLLLDSAPTRITGGGTISLADERLDLSIEGKPKKSTPVHLGGPITVGGTFKHPDIGLGAEAIARGGAAVALGVLLTPLASILGFIEPGQDEASDCVGLIREAQTRTEAQPGSSGTSDSSRKARPQAGQTSHQPR